MADATSVFRVPQAREHDVVLAIVALIWLGIGLGFGPQIAAHLRNAAAPAYPPIVHLHALAFVGWLVLLTTQVLLIRRGDRALHRRLGTAGACLAAVMVVIGPATAVTMQIAHLHDGHGDPAFLAIQLTDILAFAGLVGCGLYCRRDAASHKRLILLGSIYISDAGFARWLGADILRVAGDGFLGDYLALYAPMVAVMLLLGIGDRLTRHRLHPAYLAGLAYALALQVGAVALYRDPAWQALATRALTAWP